MNQLLDSQLTEPEVEEDQTNELEETNEETMMVLCDWAPTLGLDEEEPIDKIQVLTVNVTTKSKGPVMHERLILTKINKI